MFLRRAGRGTWVGMVMVLAATFAAGCRDSAGGGDAYPEDLGEGDRILMPVPVGYYAPSAKLDGTAELKRIDRSAKAETAGAAGAAGAAGPPPDAGVPAAEAIGELVSVHNEIVAEQAWDEYAELFVERQRAAVAQLRELSKELTPKVETLLKAVEEKAPESADRVRRLRDLVAMSDAPLNIADLKTVSDTEATARVVLPEGTPMLPGMTPVITFRKLKNTWFIESPMVDVAALTLPLMPQMMSNLDQLTAAISAGQLDAAAIAQQIDAVVTAMSGGQGTAAPQDAAPAAPGDPGDPGQGGGETGGDNDNAGG